MGALRAVEEVCCLFGGGFGLGVAGGWRGGEGVGERVGDFGGATVGPHANGVPVCE